MPYNWKYLKSNGGKEPEDLKKWAQVLDISYFLTKLLWHRGITSLQEMDIFLGPGLRHLAPLKDWPELERAADFLAAELTAGKKLAVWGDYDVDGVTATALVVHFLRQYGFEVLSYLPSRIEEGYGLNKAGLEYLAEQGAQTLFTVDCGIANIEEVSRAQQLGLSVIISDHHLPGKSLPAAQAIVDPSLNNSPYPNVAGVGVAFLLMAALNRRLSLSPVDIRQYLDLVALGTIADVVELTGENRILVKNGLLLLQKANRPGILALKEVSGLPPNSPIGSGQVSFSLAPRINAAGRLGSPEEALQLLLAPDLSTARELAANLEKYNQKRRKEEDEVLKQAFKQAQQYKDSPGLVLFDPGWHQGVIGIAASKVVEHFYRPTLLLTKVGEQLKGSGRSIAEFDLYQGLSECSEMFINFGGHRQAAGFSLSEDNLETLRQGFEKAVYNQLGTGLPEPSMLLEAKLGLDMIDLRMVKEIDMLQPFGPGNPQPVFCSSPLYVQKHNVFGQDNVSLEVRDEKAKVTMLGKAWHQAHLLGAEIKGQWVQLAFTPRLNYYNGLISIDLNIRDWRSIN